MACPECSRRLRAMEAMEIDLQNLQAEHVADLRRMAALERTIKDMHKEIIPEERVLAVFDLWVRLHGKSPKRTKLGEMRDKKIRAALKLFSQDQVEWAIRGAVRGAWVDPDTGKKYDALETILRDEGTIQRHIDAWERECGFELDPDMPTWQEEHQEFKAEQAAA